MGSTFKNFFKEIFKKGLMVTWSDGPMFDPSTQERTDGLQDLVKQKSREEHERISKDIRLAPGVKDTEVDN